MGEAGIAGVILAGGGASRMGGGDKALLPLGGRPLLAHVIERLAPQVARLAVNANGDPARFHAFGLPVIADAGGDPKGPLAGILAGMRWAADFSVSHVATVAGDTPFFPDDLVERLFASAAGDREIAMAMSGGRDHSVFALWPLALRDDLEAFIACGRSLKVADFAARHRVARVGFADRRIGTSMVDPFFNLNTPDDLAKARRMWAEGQA